MEIHIHWDTKELEVVGNITMPVLKAYLDSQWEGVDAPYPFIELDFKRYKIHPEWSLKGDTFNNIYGVGIATD